MRPARRSRPVSLCDVRERTYDIEVVRGPMGLRRAEQLAAFWAGRDVPEAAAAQARLAQTVCVLVDGDDAVAGTVHVTRAIVEPVGGQRFWVYHAELPPDAGQEIQDALLRAAFAALAEDFDPEDRDAPVGLCLLIGDLTRLRERPEAEWTDPRMYYAGYLGDGHQVRVGYFPGARLGGMARG